MTMPELTGGLSPELCYLLASVVLTFVLILTPATLNVLNNGLQIMAGPRDNLPQDTVFVARAKRLSANMLENMVLFVPLVLIANAAHVSNDMTMLGVQLFFWGRVVHAVVYLAGLPWVRPALWAVAVAGMVLIALQLV